MHSERTLIFLFFGTLFSVCLHKKRIFLLGLIFSVLNFRKALNEDSIAENPLYIRILMEMTVSIISFSAVPGSYFILERFLPVGTVLEILHLFIASAFLLKLNSVLSQKSQCGNFQIDS